MRTVTVAAAVLALLALAGCTTSTTGNAPLGQSSSTPTTTVSAAASTTLSPSGEPRPTMPPPQTSLAPLAAPTEVPAPQIDSAALGHQEQAWTSADGRTVRLNGSEGGCDRVSAELTAQSGDHVLITLVTTKYGPRPGEDGIACRTDLRNVPVEVTLAAPLGSRRIVLETREELA